MRVLTIEKDKWLRGEGSLLSKLYRSHDGKMCCLGFDAIACGVGLGAIIDRQEPNEVCTSNDEYKRTRVERNHDPGPTLKIEFMPLLPRIMRINDSEDITDDERIELLTPLLKELGWDEVRFV